MSSYLKFTPYLYLILGICLICKGIFDLNNPAENSWITFGFAVFVIFMFFFRRKYANRFEKNKKQQ